MTKLEHRHFVLIAGIIARNVSPMIRDEVAEAFAQSLRNTNPNFDHERFVSAAMGLPITKKDQ